MPRYTAPQIRSPDFWRYINLYVGLCMYMYTVSRKNIHLLFSEQLCQKLTDFNDFWHVKS